MKKKLRIWAKNLRKTLDMEKVSQKLVKKLQDDEFYINSANVMLYYPKSDEVNLLKLLEDKSKKFFLPKIEGETLLCCSYNQGEELCTSCFNTLEPKTPACDISNIDLIVVPALCCDKNNYRLGYGGGFYDRLLANYQGKTVSCIPKELLVDSVYPESFDIKLDKIIY